MKNRRRKFNILMATGMIFALAGSPSISSAGGEIHPLIKNVSLYREGNHLKADISIAGLFSEKIAGTIRSGLPAVVRLDYKLVETGNLIKSEGEISWSLRYDVWESRYSISSSDTNTILDSFESMRHMMENLRSVSLFPIRKMLRGRSYYLALRISVSPFGKGKPTSEITERTADDIRSDDENTRREKLLNINKMISWFLKRKRDKAGTSEWYRSSIFKPEWLAIHGREVD